MLGLPAGMMVLMDEIVVLPHGKLFVPAGIWGLMVGMTVGSAEILGLTVETDVPAMVPRGERIGLSAETQDQSVEMKVPRDGR